MLALADLYMGRDPEGHYYNNSTDVRVAVNCVDQPPVTSRADKSSTRIAASGRSRRS